MLRFYHRINTSNMYLKFMQAHRDQRQSIDLNLIWFGCIITLPSGEEGSNFLVQVLSTCLCYARGGGGGVVPCEINTALCIQASVVDPAI
jgi:hypothetical protein